MQGIWLFESKEYEELKLYRRNLNIFPFILFLFFLIYYYLFINFNSIFLLKFILIFKYFIIAIRSNLKYTL